MTRFRALFFVSIIFGVVAVSAIFIQQAPQPPFPYSLAALFQELGKPIKTVDRVISHTFPIDELDEKMLGDEIKSKLDTIALQCEEDSVSYLNSLIQSLSDESCKPFQYTVFLLEGPPNACAFPGGAICITKELLQLLENEAELASVLGHEIGHIERGHLFDAARNEILRRKAYGDSNPFYITECLQAMMELAFNKSQEDEADEYSFRLLVKKKYDPFAISSAFEKLKESHIHTQQSLILIDDFFATHPHSDYSPTKRKAL